MARWFGKKDEVAKQRAKAAKAKFAKCGHKRTYKSGTAEITVTCQKDCNVPHRHD